MQPSAKGNTVGPADPNRQTSARLREAMDRTDGSAKISPWQIDGVANQVFHSQDGALRTTSATTALVRDVRSVAAPPAEPMLVFDGDCEFCRFWVARLRSRTGEAVKYEPLATGG